MPSELHNDLRKEFQLERLILFSDAVFAIAITLLVIEIKIPGQEELRREGITDFTDEHLLTSLRHLIPKFIGFLISFILIGQYWIVHHRMFGYVIHFNSKLIWFNLMFLLGIALMPFSTGFYSDYAAKPVLTPVIFYTFNMAILGVLNFFMWRYLANTKNGLTENLTPELARYSAMRAISVPVIFIICCFVYMQSPIIASFIPAMIPFVMRFAFAPLKKKALLAKTKSL